MNTIFNQLKYFKTLVLILTITSGYGQKNYSNNQVGECVENIQLKVDSLVNLGQEEKGMTYVFDSINICYQGVNLRHFSFTSQSNAEIDFSTLKKPTILKFSASWCAPCIAEINAINQIAEDYGDKIKIIIIFWDDLDYIKRVKSKYNSKIELVESDVKGPNNSFLEVSNFRHYLGYPASYFLDSNQEIKFVSRGASTPRPESENMSELTQEDADIKNYKRIKGLLEEYIFID